MAFTDVFGGELIFPSQLSYLSITTAIDVTLQWPTEQQITGGNVVADFIDVDTTVAALNIDMPSALVTGTGNKATFNNVGANTFTVRDSTGGTIQSVAPGETWVVVLRDNTTVAGLWRTFQLGANVAVASASALAGAGIKAIGVLLNQQIDSDVEAATPFTVVDGDRAKCLIYTAGAGVANLPSVGTVGNDWFFMLRNSGSGTLAVTPPSGNIDGSSSINLDPNDSAFIFTDGTDYFTIGLSTGSTIAFDFVSLPIPGSGDFVLSGANLNRISYRFTGALTGNRRVVVPNTTQQYWGDNQTTGAFNLTISTAAQVSPPNIGQGEAAIFYCDGTNVINAVSEVSVTLPLVVAQGGTGATTVGGAQVNLQVPPNSRLLTAGAGLTGGGDLSADRTLDVGAGTGITVNANDVQTNDSAIDHDALLNFVANDHIDHSTISLLAGTGIDATGLGDLTVSRTINALAASEIQVGVTEIANQAETDAGTDDARIVTPLKLTDFIKVTGSFTATLTGFVVNPTGTINFTITGNVCTLYNDGALISNTSNANTMVMTGLPAAVQPVNSTTVSTEGLRDNSINANSGSVTILSGIVSFLIGDPKSASGFTASGSKGIAGGWSITYTLG